MNYTDLVNALSEHLKLEHAPIGMAFLSAPPAGVARWAGGVPSACTFWKLAESSLFYATADDHYNCPIGAMTQGFSLPQEVMQKAMELVGQMDKIEYFKAAEAGQVPTVKKGHAVIVYGPLLAFGEIKPDLALFLATPFQAMMISEASGAVAWGNATEMRASGRPACAVIPSALDRAGTAVSMACMGARTFAGIREGELIVALPAPALERLGAELPKILAANSEMKCFYDGRKAEFASA